ncbi:hypothetical protein D5086_023707 [Populus alba]|uniref:Uncharacterized protein n=1 Tax=Populus alba TaxID=43335 RepID=A0ACC4BB82_POPAL
MLGSSHTDDIRVALFAELDLELAKICHELFEQIRLSSAVTIELLAIGYRLCHKKHWTSIRCSSMMMNGNYRHKSLAAVHISIVLCLSNQEGSPAKLLYTAVKAFFGPNMLLSKVFSWFHKCTDGEASNGQN